MTPAAVPLTPSPGVPEPLMFTVCLVPLLLEMMDLPAGTIGNSIVELDRRREPRVFGERPGDKTVPGGHWSLDGQ